MLIQTAESDIRAVNRNRGESTAFLKQHVKGATTAAEVLQRALLERYRGLGAKSKYTRVVYESESLLRAAIALATPA
jgi:hypothetical protein